MTIFLPTKVSFFNPCQDKNVHTYAITKQLEKNVFTMNNPNINRKTRIQVAFNLDIKPKVHFFRRI